MSNDITLRRFNHNENVRLNSRPYVVFRTNGPSYLSKRAASLLNLENGSTMALYYTSDLLNWYLCNDEIGATVLKNGGLFRFCDTKAVKKIFKSYKIEGTKAFFLISDTIEKPSCAPIKPLRLINLFLLK